MKVPMMFPCFPSLRLWALLEKPFADPNMSERNATKHVCKPCPPKQSQTKRHQEQPPFSKQCWRFECNHLHKQYLRARRTCHARHVSLSPPFLISHTKKERHCKEIDMLLPWGTRKLAKITTFGPTGSEVRRFQVQARHKCTCCTAWRSPSGWNSWDTEAFWKAQNNRSLHGKIHDPSLPPFRH